MRSVAAPDLRGATDAGLKADINVTPLVDVCLVLLIIFMVVTPYLVRGVSVQLPETARPEKMPEGARQLAITIQQDGTLYLGEDRVPEDQLLTRLVNLHDTCCDRTVVVRADRRIAYAHVRNVMKLVHQAGFAGAGLVVHERAQGT